MLLTGARQSCEWWLVTRQTQQCYNDVKGCVGRYWDPILNIGQFLSPAQSAVLFFVKTSTFKKKIAFDLKSSVAPHSHIESRSSVALENINNINDNFYPRTQKRIKTEY